MKFNCKKMSWFGEHLTSFTEKITDFTKDMLPDSGSNSSISDDPYNQLQSSSSVKMDNGEERSLLTDQPSQSISFTPKQLLELCGQKDAELEILRNEKILLENSIEELESQHQEAVNKLLDLKNEAVKENAVLKQELATHKACNSAQLLFQKFEHNYHPRELKTDEIQLITEDMCSNSMKSFNFFNIIGVLWKNYGEESLKKLLKFLKEQKLLLEAQDADDEDNSIHIIIKRINNYIKFLQLMVENPESFFPVIDEIATVIHFLLSDNVSENSRYTVPENINRQSTSNSLPVTQVETSDFSSQAAIKDFELVRNLFSEYPEPFLCSNSAQSPVYPTGASSQYVQTDDEHTVQNCSAIISELKDYVLYLEQEKSDLEEEVSQMGERVSNLERLRLPASSSSVFIQTENIQDEISCVGTRNCPMSSTTVQTDDFDVNTSNEKLFELEAYVNILEQEKSDFQDKINELQNITDKPAFSTQTQTINDVDTEANNTKLLELETYINILEHEKLDLQDKIMELKSKFDKSTSLAQTQTIDDVNNKNNSTELLELETYISILEHEKSEFQNKIQELQSVIDKSTFSVTTQTDNFTCDCNVYELEANICILEQDKADLIEKVLYLESLINKPKLSVHIQTEENSVQYEMLKTEIATLQEMINIKDRDYMDSFQEMNNDLNDYKEKLKFNESLIQEKESIIQSLEHDLEEYKNNINDLTAIMQQSTSLTSVEVQTEENNCSCKQYESQIAELMRSMNEREKEYNTIQNQTIISVNNLKKELNSYECIIADKDSMLNNVNFELEKCQKVINNLTDELNNLKETAVIKANECCHSCEKYESEVEELKHCIREKENEIAAIETKLISNINNLKELLQEKDLLINDKEEAIHSLKSELEEAKISIKKHLGDLKVFKSKQDYAKDIDTMEECDIKMIIQHCNRCENVLNGESNDNDLKNEVRVLQDKLKALDMDKNQLLCVLNEKTQECSSLKAEVHKLTNIVASEKQALYKLQQDNCVLRESRDNADPELTKEAIKNLSRIIRDKDLEIESLKQKNVTLTTLIQDTTSVPDHMHSLLEEKENLMKQINVFKADRDKIMLRYNTIDKDCRQYAAEVKNLQSALSDQKEKFDVLEQKHFSVAQQYEEKQKSLINTQNEMIALKQRVSDLEQQQVDIKEKYSDLLNKFNSDTTVQLTKDELEEKNSQIEQLITANSEKDHLIQEKDCLIHDLSQQIKTLKLEHEQQQQNLLNLQAKVEELTAKLKELDAAVDKHQNEKEALELRFQDKSSELGLLKDMNERLNMSLKEKEFTIQSMTEKISSLSHYISSDHTTSGTVDINQILADSESMFSKAQLLYKERDETLLALNQSKQENQSLRNEIQRMKSNEIHLKKELERLRMHLLEIEENYTTEALKAEEREKELRDELVEVKRRAEISNTAIVDTNQRASIQIASLQEQLSIIANQRDQALAQVSTLEDKVQQHSASVSKLQLVLEQMQRGNDKKIKEREKKFIVQLDNQKQLYKELEEKLQAKEMQLLESTQALEAASRLSEQLDAKEEVIAYLKNELSKTESKIKSTAQEIDTIKSNTEGKVDRVVMKSLVLGYFSTPPGQKSEVIRLLARVLDFNQEEMEKAGIVVGRNAHKNEQRGLFSSIFGRLPSLSPEKSPPSPEKSFTTLFVQFLENESQPIVPMPFPAEKMAHDLSFKQHTTKKSPTAERKSISRSNPLLLDIDSAFPTFSPVPAVEYSQAPAPSILREVLE